MQPCQQTDAFEKINEKLDKFGEALLVLAVQRNEIEHLDKAQKEQREWLKGHETRIQGLEKHPGDSASKFLWMLCGGGISLVSSIVVVVMKG